MAKLEELNPGAWVSILPDALVNVNVIDVKWHDPSVVDLGEPDLAAASVAGRPDPVHHWIGGEAPEEATILRGVRR
jgi:hypothetical protein